MDCKLYIGCYMSENAVNFLKIIQCHILGFYTLESRCRMYYMYVSKVCINFHHMYHIIQSSELHFITTAHNDTFTFTLIIKYTLFILPMFICKYEILLGIWMQKPHKNTHSFKDKKLMIQQRLPDL